MAQRNNRKRRKERQRAAGQATPPTPADSGEPSEAPLPDDFMARGYARGRMKDEEARAKLVPLKEGERPGAVTVAAVVSFLLGAANLISYVAGVEVQGEQPTFFGIAIYSALMFTVSYGCFRARYWGVLGMQAVLALGLLIFGVLLLRAESFLALGIALLVLGLAGTLFWKLVKAMARIQMPPRPGADA